MSFNLGNVVKDIGLKYLLILVLFILAILVFIFFTHLVIIRQEEMFDKYVFRIVDNEDDSIMKMMAVLTFFGKPDFLIPAYLLLIFFFLFKKKNIHALNMFIIGSSSTALLFGLKYFFQRPRPDFPVLRTLGGYSFPSGHAFLTFVLCSIFIFFIWNGNMHKLWKWVLSVFLILFSIAVGISRIFLRYHYASDVIAGFCIGFSYVITYLWIQKKRQKAVA